MTLEQLEKQIQEAKDKVNQYLEIVEKLNQLKGMYKMNELDQTVGEELRSLYAKK